MKSRKILLSSLLLLALGTATADPDDHDDVKRLRDAGEILSLETLIEKYHKRDQDGRILEADLEYENGRYLYELKVLYEDGTVLELEYDASTGGLLRTEREDM